MLLLEVALVATLLAYAGVWLAIRPSRSVPAAFVAAFVTLPAFIPTTFAVGGFEIQAFEPLLAVAAMWALTSKGKRPAGRVVVTLLVLAIYGVALGIYAGADPVRIVGDVRPLTHLIAATIVAARIVGTPDLDTCARVLPRLLWFSAIVTLLASVFGFAVNGRTEVAALTAGALDGPARLLTPSSYLAVAVVCACGALAVARRQTLRQNAQLLVPALLIMALAFSRNNLLSVAVAAVFALAATRQARSVAFSIGAIIATTVVVGVLVLAQPIIAGLPGGQFVSQQIDGYSDRVIGGLSGEVRSTDSSVLYRDNENDYLRPKIAERPVVGHGFGMAYRPPAGTSGFFLESAPYYAHHYYYWLTFKTGIIGLLVFAAATLTPLLRVLRQGGPAAGVAAALAGLLVASIVAPMPNGQPGAALVGLLLGLVVALCPAKPKDERVRTRPRPVRTSSRSSY